MAAPKKKLDPIKQRERRSKIAAAVGGLLLVAIAAYEVPATMKMMKKSAPPPPPPAAPATASSAAGVLPNLAGAASVAGTSSAGAAPGQLVDSDLMPATGPGQLVSFSVFETKNPFTPQVSSNTGSSSGNSSTTTTANKPGADVSRTSTTARTATTPAATAPPATTPTATTPTAPTAPTAPVPPTVVPPGASSTTATPASQPTLAISVNDIVSRVASGGTFPTGSPVFRVVSWTKDTVQVGIVGGSYATGDATLTLHLRRPVTLENQTDGKRYRLELLSTP